MRGIDRFWWARIIRQARVVDLEFVAAQVGRRVTERQAVRRYVQGAFRHGFVLNPLFLDSFVSQQLPDSDRVPALYAYLVNDPGRLDVSPNWVTSEHIRRYPAALDAPGGPLGHAWRHVSGGGSLEMGWGALQSPVPGAVILGVAMAAARECRLGESSQRSYAQGMTSARRTTLVALLAPDECPAQPLRAALEFGMEPDQRSVVLMSDPRTDAWVHASLAAAWHRYVTVEKVDGSSSAMRAAEIKSTTIGVTVTRGPASRIDARALGELAAAAAEGPIAPLWLKPDGTVASAGGIIHRGRPVPLLAGHPVEDALSLGASIDVHEIDAPTYASPARGHASLAHPRTLLSTCVIAPGSPMAAAQRDSGTDTDLDAIVSKLGMAVKSWTITPRGPEPLLRRDIVTTELPDGTTVPRLRWAIKTSAPAGPAGESWGDTHFARGIAEALRRLGQDVVVDAYAARDRPTDYLDDVTLTLRGPHPISAKPGRTSLLWIISHPDEVTASEITPFDRVFAASEVWARRASHQFRRRIDPLLQCTDPHRFHPRGLPRGAEVVFVGTARGIARPSVVEPIRAGVPVSVYGPDWRGFIPGANIVAEGIANDALSEVYERAHVVLNDHWPAMRREGFISNRIYDVVACGGRVISDDVADVAHRFEGAVVTYDTVPELLAMFSADINALFADEQTLAAISERVRQYDSFDARAMTLLREALAARAAKRV